MGFWPAGDGGSRIAATMVVCDQFAPMADIFQESLGTSGRDPRDPEIMWIPTCCAMTLLEGIAQLREPLRFLTPSHASLCSAHHAAADPTFRGSVALLAITAFNTASVSIFL
jgi:hypothetical protein